MSILCIDSDLKYVLGLPDFADVPKEVDGLKSASHDSLVHKKTIIKIIEGKANFQIETLQSIVRNLGIRYFVIPIAQNSALSKLVSKYCTEIEACWIIDNDKLPDMIAHLLEDSPRVDKRCESVAEAKIGLQAALGYALTTDVAIDDIIEIYLEATDKMHKKIKEKLSHK